VKFTPKGTSVCKFGLAVNRTWYNDAKEKQEEVTFIDVEAWGKQAETIAQYCKKGGPLFVEGRIKLDSWEDKKTGEKRTKLGVVLEGFQLLGSGGERTQRATPKQHPNEVSTPTSNEPTDTDDVPF
jgi:single-strand DNA-binding protein